MDTEANISFAGCGFLGIYHIGVSACLKKFAPHLLQNKIGGSSAGAMCAVALVCDIPLEAITRKVLMMASGSKRKIFGPFNPSFDLQQITKDSFEDLLPEDVAERVSGKLYLSITKARNKTNILVSEFHDKSDVIDALCAASFVPVMSGIFPPKFRGEFAIDGLYSDNIPDLGGFTITVSPFTGDSTIGPSDDNLSSLIPSFPHGSGGSLHLSKENMRRLKNAMLPPDTSAMEKICSQGFRDALKYLESENLVKYHECLKENKVAENCEMCIEKKEWIKKEDLPIELVEVFEDIRLVESTSVCWGRR